MKTPWEKDKMNFDKMQIASGDKKEGEKVDPLIFDEIGQMPSLNKVSQENDKILALTNGALGFYAPPSLGLKYELKNYPDQTQYVIVGAGSELTFRVNHYSDLWTLNQINDVLLKQKRTVALTIPNLIDAQADRRFAPNQPAGLKLVCEFLNGLKAFHTIKVFHPHNAEVVEALIDRVQIIDNANFIEKVFLKLASVDDVKFWGKDIDKNLILMSSDAGGFKPLMKLADKLQWKGETFSASKSRKYEEGHSKLIQEIDKQDFNGKDILIIDDICVYGGTFKGLAKLLKERNCGKLYLAVSHLTVNDLGNDPVTNYFDKVFTTNSKFDSDRYISWDHDIHKQLVVIDLF